MINTKIRISSSVANFREKVLKNWKVEEYQYPKDINKPVCFFGMYHEGDWQSFKNHKGKKMIFWCGSDILNWKAIPFMQLGHGMIKHVCENEVEQMKLKEYGIKAEIHPTFAGNVDDYQGSKKEGKDVWLCVHEGREEEYGLKAIRKTASAGIHTYHVYGIKKRNEKNIKYHGNVPEKQLDEEIKEYQIALRSNKFEGFSEVVAKGILLEQIVWSNILYPKMNNRKYWAKKLSDLSWLKIKE